METIALPAKHNNQKYSPPKTHPAQRDRLHSQPPGLTEHQRGGQTPPSTVPGKSRTKTQHTDPQQVRETALYLQNELSS